MSTLIFGLQVAMIAMSIVFLALFVLSVCIQLQEKLFRKTEKKPHDKSEKSVKKEPVPAVISPEIQEDNQEELIAVIAAAISACGHQVIVKNIKRVYGNTGVPWPAASRTDNMNLRKISVK